MLQKAVRSMDILLDKVVVRPLGHKRPSGQCGYAASHRQVNWYVA